MSDDSLWDQRRGIGRATLQGALAGFGDEATAAVAAGLAALKGESSFSAAYDDILRAEREGLHDYARAHPVVNFGSELAGSLLPSTALMRAARLLGDPMRMSRATRLARTGRIATKVAQSPVAQGAVLGGVAGAGASDETNRLGGAATGTAFGAGITAGLGVMGKALHSLGRMMGLTNIDKDTAKALLDAMKKDGLDPRTVLAEVNSLVNTSQRPAALADIVALKKAPTTQRLINEALSESGAHRPKVAQHLEDRLMGQKDRVLWDMADALNRLPQSTRETIQSLIERQQKVAGPLYEKAFASDRALKDTRLWEILGTPAGQKALKAAQVLAENERSPLTTRWALKHEVADIPETLFTGAETNGRLQYVAPNIRSFDYIKRKLWDQAQELRRAGQKEEAKAVDKLRRDMVNVLDEIGPDEYKAARAAFKGPAELIEATETGSNLFKIPVSELRETVAKMSAAEKDALLAGFAGHVSELPLKSNQDFAAQLINDSNKLARIRAIMPDQQAYERLLERLRAESVLTTGAKAYPGASLPSTPGLQEAIGVARLAAGDKWGMRDIIRGRLSMRPEREAERLTEFGFGRTAADDFRDIRQYLERPPQPGPIRPAFGETVGGLSLLGTQDPGFKDRIAADLQELERRPE